MSSSIRLFADNYADSELYANLLYSSQQSSFPVSNTLARMRRSKVWRSNGSWVVDSTNKVIIFRESDGVDITATIVEGTYTTATLLTAIKTALELLGVATYTVTQNSNYKIVIASNLGGGATVFELRMADASTTAESLLGFAATNLSGASSYTADYLRINTEEYITFDLGLPTDITGFAMTGFRNSSIKLSPGGTFKLQGNYTNSWTSPLYDQTLTYDSEVIYALDDDGLYTEPLRYWRVLFQDQNSYGYVEIGAISLSVIYTPSRGAVQFPFGSDFQDLSKPIVSEGGQTFSEVREKTQGFKATWKFLTKEEVEELTSIFETYGLSHPFFVSLDTDAVFSSSANRMLKYVKFASEPQYTLETPNNFTMSMNFEEQL